MIEFEECDLVSIYVAIVAFFLIIGLLVFRSPLKLRSRFEQKLILSLYMLTMLISIMEVISSLMWYFGFDRSRIAIFVTSGIIDIFDIAAILLWFIFVEYLIYQSEDMIRRRFWITAIPAGFISVLTIVYMVGGSFFYSDNYLVYMYAPISNIIDVIKLFYLIITYVLLAREQKRKKMPQFLKLTPFVFPVVVSTLFTGITVYWALSFGLAVGLVLMNFSMIDRICYHDDETGFYNKAYLTYLIDYNKQHGYSNEMEFTFNVESDPIAFANMLRSIAPDNSVCVRTDENSFLMISEKQNKSLSGAFVSMVEGMGRQSGLNISGSYKKT